MDDVLNEIKRAVLSRRVAFTNKAEREMDADQLTRVDVYESLMNAKTYQAKRSRSEFRQRPREKVYIIVAPTFSGIRIYTKGVFRKKQTGSTFYVLISSKRSTENERRSADHGRV